jgi:hypothetical protein
MLLKKIHAKLDSIKFSIGALDDNVQYLARRLRESDRRLAFVYGSGVCEQHDYAPDVGGTFRQVAEPKKVSVNIGSTPIYMSEGGSEMVRIDPVVRLEGVALQVEAPFVIQDLMVGRDSICLASDGVTRIVYIEAPVQVGQRISVHISWPKDEGAYR